MEGLVVDRDKLRICCRRTLLCVRLRSLGDRGREVAGTRSTGTFAMYDVCMGSRVDQVWQGEVV